MKRILSIALLLSALAGAAWAASNVQAQNGGYVNAKTGAAINSTGAALVDDAARDRDNWTVWTNAINDTATVGSAIGTSSNPAGAAYQAESTAVLTTAPYRRIVLWLDVKPAAGDTSTVIRVAVQIRKHTSALADSASMGAWAEWANVNAIANPDSVTNASGVSGWPSGNLALPLPNERVFSFSPVIGLGGQASRMANSGPRMLTIDVVGSHGEVFWSPYTSVRVRVLGGARKPRIVMHVAAGS